MYIKMLYVLYTIILYVINYERYVISGVYNITNQSENS